MVRGNQFPKSCIPCVPVLIEFNSMQIILFIDDNSKFRYNIFRYYIFRYYIWVSGGSHTEPEIWIFKIGPKLWETLYIKISPVLLVKKGIWVSLLKSDLYGGADRSRIFELEWVDKYPYSSWLRGFLKFLLISLWKVTICMKNA